MALGSAVTKRGQDNSLQMCERCKYQAGGGEAARRARERGPGLGSSPRGLGTLGRLPPYGCPLSSGAVGGGTGCRGTPGSKQGFHFWGAASPARRCPPSPIPAPLGTCGRGFKSHPSPSAPLGTRPFPLLPGPPAGPSSAALAPAPPRRPGSRPAPLPGRAGGGGSPRGGSLWRRCARRSLCRGAGSRGNANEANPGRRAEAPGGDGREGARVP